MLGLTQARLSGSNVNYNGEGWSESPATLDNNNPEFLSRVTRRQNKKENLALRHDTAHARIRERERKHFTMRRTGDVFFLLSLPLSALFSLLFFYFFFFGIARVP